MSQFDKKPKMDEKVITSLTDLGGMYGEHTNLTMRCRLGWVQGIVNPTKKSKAPGVFSAVLIGSDGVADLSIWDPETIQSWQAQIGSIVTITGMSCSRMKPASLDFARAPGDYTLNVNKGRYTISIMKGTDDPSIPKNGTCPPGWLRRAVTPPQSPRPSMWPSPISANFTQGGTCCDTPDDPTCKVSGLAHVATCGACRGIVNEKQPYCSKQAPGSLIKCSPALRIMATVPSSPFKEIASTREEEDLPPPKVLKMSVVREETEDEE